MLQLGQHASLQAVHFVQLLDVSSWGLDAGEAMSSSVSVILVDGIGVLQLGQYASLQVVHFVQLLDVSSWGLDVGEAMSSSVSVILVDGRYKC